MPRFFFHLDYIWDRVSDPEGSECADLAAAQAEAGAIIRELAAESLAQDRLFEPKGISISDEAGQILAQMSVAEAIADVFPMPALSPPDPKR